MALLGRRRGSVGLDIGSGYVKIVAVDHSTDRPEVTRVAMRPLLPEAIVEGEIMDAGLVADTIGELHQEAGVKGKEVVTAIGGHGVIIKTITMDRMGEEEAREVVRWEAEEHVPFDIESVELDFRILNPLDGGPRMEVLLVAAKREIVDERVNLILEAGLSPMIVDIDAFALHNAFERNYPDAMEGIVALVDVGHETTKVNVLDDGVPILNRDIPFGSRRLGEDLQRERGLAAAEAEDVLRGRKSHSDFASFVEASVGEVAAGIERASAFLLARESGGGLGRIYLSGGGAKIPGMADALGSRVGVETRLANPFEQVGVRPDAAEAMALEEIAPMLLLPLGLGLRRPWL